MSEMTAAVQLIQALGGGWDATQLPYTCAGTRKTPSNLHESVKITTQANGLSELSRNAIIYHLDSQMHVFSRRSLH